MTPFLGSACEVRAKGDAVPKRERLMRILLDFDSNGFDPNNLTAGANRRLMNSIAPGLARASIDYSLQPLLAREIRVDGRDLVVDLREGLELHDGRSVDGALVAANLNHIRGSADCFQSSEFRVVKEISAPRRMQVRLRFDQMPSSFPALIANHIGITNVDDTVDPVLPIGAGAFAIRSRIPGESVVLTPWKHGIAVANKSIGEVRLDFETDPAKRATRFMDEQYDAVVNPPVDSLPELIHRGFRASIQPSRIVTHLAFNHHRMPWHDREARRAIGLAIDNASIATALFGPFGSAAHGTFAPHDPWFVGYHRAPFDPAASAQMLRALGLHGLDVTIDVDGFAGQRVGDIVAEQLARVGLAVTVRRHDTLSWWPGFYRGGEWSLAVQSWFPMTDPDQILRRLYGVGGVFNVGGFGSAELDRLLAEARTEVDTSRRSEIYRSAERLLSSEAVAVPLFHPPSVTVTRTDVRGAAPNVHSEFCLEALRFVD